MASPISQLLNSLGITREDLSERSEQLKRFLNSDSRVPSVQLSSSASDTRSLSRASSSTAIFTRQPSHPSSITTRDASPTPAATSVKSEPAEEALPARQFDSMEAVLERQRLNRKQKRSRRREQEPHEQDWAPDSRDASPDAPRQPATTHPRDDSRVLGVLPRPSATQLPPETPTRSKYYREHTSYNGPKAPLIKAESPSPSPTAGRAPVPAYPYPYHQYSAAPNSQSRFLSLPFRSAQAVARTPVKPTRFQQSSSPLPPSSPPDATSPASSPAHRLVNIVSSPGPMSEGEDEEKAMPYTLPSGPYSHERPHYSYAALIGQAILSSPDHRLTLQEIYEWIITVYPHYKRGERTWMNSIRHVLSTTVHFRKISRERSAGRSHWAIFDEDLECFADKNYRRPGAMVKRPPAPRIKKRPVDEVDDEASSSKTGAKRLKNAEAPPLPTGSLAPSISAIPSEQPPFLLPALIHPHGKPTNTRTGSHHQSYYESCKPAPIPFVPSDIIFPPLPNSSNRLIATNISSTASSAAARIEDDGRDLESEEETGNEVPSSPLLSSSAPNPPSTPALTPNNSSSSPIPDSDGAPQSDKEDPAKIIKEESREESTHSKALVTIAGLDGDDGVFRGSVLRPVQFWEDSAAAGEVLQPGIQLQESVDQDESDDEDDVDVPLFLLFQANELETRRATASKARATPKLTPSPTLHRRKTAAAARIGSKGGKRKKTTAKAAPTIVDPSTPPRNSSRRRAQTSPMFTPLAHKDGSSASLAYLKSHLDPPPALVHGTSKRRSDEEDDFQDNNEPPDLMRTPSRKRNPSGSSAHPVTPRRLLFSTDSSSPYRTPGGGALGTSPFRTPLGYRGGIFDPHDPSTLLDEEFSRLNSVGRDSPAGLYAKGSLYDSPNPLDGSPGKWARWW